MSVTNGNFVTDEQWLGDGSTKSWIETGYVTSSNANIGLPNGRVIYWADDRPNHDYYVHNLQSGLSASDLTARRSKIYQDDDDHTRWHVSMGTYSSQSTGNTMNPDTGDYGSESDNANSCSWSYFLDLSYESSNNRGYWESYS